MANVTFHGNPVEISGTLPAVGDVLEGVNFTAKDLSEVSLDAYAGKRKVLNIFPSIDTPTCATSVRTFNAKAAELDNTVVLCISADLPFAQARFCGTDGIDNVENLSVFRNDDVRQKLGVALESMPLKGLCARAVLVLDADNKVLYSEMVAEVADEPNYDAALAAL